LWRKARLLTFTDEAISELESEQDISASPDDITVDIAGSGFDIEDDRVVFSDEAEIEPEIEFEDDFIEQQQSASGLDLFEDLDEQTPIDLDIDDVDFEVDGDEVTVELTDDAQQQIATRQSAIDEIGIDLPSIQPGIQTESFDTQQIGSETRPMPLEDPLRDTEPQGLAVGDTQLIGAGDDLPSSIGEIGDIEFGSDELVSTDLPTSLRETTPIVRQTSRDVARIPAERAVGSAVQRSTEAQQLIDGDFDEVVDSPSAQTAVAAGAAGIAAPEPTTTIGGAVVAGGAIAGAGAIDLAQRGEIEVDPQEIDQDRSELEVSDASIGQAELEATATQRQAEIETPTEPTPINAEIETPSTGDVLDGTEIGVPTAQAQQVVEIAGQERLVEDLDELLDEDEADRLRREELSETARQQFEQQIFEQERTFGEIERETVPERDRFEPIEIDDIGEGIAGRGDPETFGERDETFGERFDRIIEERQQEEQRFFEQEDSVVTSTRPEQTEAAQQTEEFASAAFVGSFEAPAAPEFSPPPAATGVDEFQDIGVSEWSDAGFEQPAQFGTPQSETDALATEPMVGLNEAAMQAQTALQESSVPTEQAIETSTEDVFAEPTLTETGTQPAQQPRQDTPFPRPEFPDFDSEFGADDGLEEFDIWDDRTVRQLDDPDFLDGTLDDDMDDIPDPMEGL